MEVSENSLLNLLRHAYLLGYNEGISACAKVNHKPSVQNPPTLTETDREEYIKLLVEDQINYSHTCYGEYPCDCEDR